MIFSHGKVLIFLSIFALLLVSSCRWEKGIQLKSTLSEARKDLMSGDFQKALDAYQSAYQKNKQDGEMLRSYIEAVQYIKLFGDRAFDKKDFAQAQIIYDLLLRNFFCFSDFANLLPFDRSLLVTRVGLSRTLGVEKQVQSSLKTGELQRAIDACRDLQLRHPQDTIVQDRYIKLLELIKSRADRTFGNNDLVLAGWTYRILQRNHPSQAYLARLLSYNADSLQEKIRTCQKTLFDNGLEQYRSGDLSQAISIWKSILTFDPENPEVKRAVDTATLQSRKLKKDKAYDAK